MIKKIAIDASNISIGGGLTHLIELLNVANPRHHGFIKIVVWASSFTLSQIKECSWIKKNTDPVLEGHFLQRALWQRNRLNELAKQEKCDLLFVPGGLFFTDFQPVVTMFQNMQIFESRERNREGLSKEWLRLRLLQSAQSRTFQAASGLICLSEYARNYLTQYHSHLIARTPVQLIAHGTENLQHDHFMSHHEESPANHETLRLLYVSTVKKYKHQWNLIDAVGLLRNEGISIELHLVGGGDPQALHWMREAIQRNHSDHEFVFYHGSLPYEETLEWYQKVDLFAYPSTCENLPVILLEAMSAGLPIASSDRGPMPEVLKDAGLYFNPESVTSMKNCLRYLIDNPDLRQRLSTKAKQYSQAYSWKKCADETFAFFRSVYEGSKA